jgi:Zn-dependent protease
VSEEPWPAPGATVRLLGIPIRIEPAFLLVLGVLGFAGRGTLLSALEWILLAGISILLHELGHAAAYRRFGIQPRVRLYSFGGLTYGEALSPARSIVVSLAGPVTGLLVGLAILAAYWALGWVMPARPRELEVVVGDLLYINLGWSAFNLLPVLPLDGGNVAAAMFQAANRGRGLAIGLSLVVSGLIIVAAALVGQAYIAILGVFLMAWNWRSRALQREAPQLRLLARSWNELYWDPSAASATAMAVATKPVSHDIRFEAIEILGWAGFASGSTAEVRDALSRLGDGAVGSRLFRACARLALEGDGSGMAEALAAAYVERRHLAVTTIASRLIADAGLVDAVISEADELAGNEHWRSLLLLQIGLHENGRYADSIRVGTLIFERHRDLDAAYAAAWVARSLNLAGDQHGAVTWLGRAVERGLAWADIARHEDFASLAGNRDFEAIRSSDAEPVP